MARLDLDDKGGSFLDLKLAQRDGRYFAVATLRVAAGPGCSGLVMHEEFDLGMAASFRTWVRAILEDGRQPCMLPLAKGKVSFTLFPTDLGLAILEARCGEVTYSSDVSEAAARAFCERLLKAAKSMAIG